MHSALFHKNINPKFIGYCHWYEVPENTAYAKSMLMHNIAGTLEMEECGVNTKWLKDLIIEKSKLIYTKDVTDRLEKIIQPHELSYNHLLLLMIMTTKYHSNSKIRFK